ncbi:MAG: hypothetical protein WKF30_04270 [Pyrinomonadaceae bacterium]
MLKAKVKVESLAKRGFAIADQLNSRRLKPPLPAPLMPPAVVSDANFTLFYASAMINIITDRYPIKSTV